MTKNIIEKIKNLVIFSTGVLGHHYESKLLECKKQLETEKKNENPHFEADTKTKLSEVSVETDSVSTIIKKIVEDIEKGKGVDSNNFLPSYENLHNYLNNLNLMQDSAIFHIFAFISIIFIVFNILSILLANEIIKYFNLENKFPSLAIFLS